MYENRSRINLKKPSFGFYEKMSDSTKPKDEQVSMTNFKFTILKEPPKIGRTESPGMRFYYDEDADELHYNK